MNKQGLRPCSKLTKEPHARALVEAHAVLGQETDSHPHGPLQVDASARLADNGHAKGQRVGSRLSQQGSITSRKEADMHSSCVRVAVFDAYITIIAGPKNNHHCMIFEIGTKNEKTLL